MMRSCRGADCRFCIRHRSYKGYLLLDAVQPLIDLVEISNKEPVVTRRTEGYSDQDKERKP
jgi:hypothetical protein